MAAPRAPSSDCAAKFSGVSMTKYGLRAGPMKSRMMVTTPFAIRLAVAASRTTRLGTWPVVALEVRVRLTSSAPTKASGGFALNTPTGRYGRSAILSALQKSTGHAPRSFETADSGRRRTPVLSSAVRAMHYAVAADRHRKVAATTGCQCACSISAGVLIPISATATGLSCRWPSWVIQPPPSPNYRSTGEEARAEPVRPARPLRSPQR